MSMKITKNILKKVIKESIIRTLNESMGYYYTGDDFESSGTFEKVIEDIGTKQYIFKSYADQLFLVTKDLMLLSDEIVDMLNNNFNLGISSLKETTYQCEIGGDEMIINVDIPTKNFAEACKKNGAVMEVFNEEEGPKDLAHLINCGRYCDWRDLSFETNGRNIKFEPVTYSTVKSDNLEIGDSVPCQVIISNVF